MQQTKPEGKDAHALVFHADNEFAEFMDGMLTVCEKADNSTFEGRVVGWCFKVAYDPEARKAQHKFITNMVRQVFGPQMYDFDFQKKRDDTFIAQ